MTSAAEDPDVSVTSATIMDSDSASARSQAQTRALNKRLESALSALEVLRPTVDLTLDDSRGGPSSQQPPSGFAQLAALQSTLMNVKKERDDIEEYGQGEALTFALFIDRKQSEIDVLQALVSKQRGQIDALKGQVDSTSADARVA